MKVLVFGVGVIGGQLAHALSLSGNDVTVVARGAWAETLRQNGLCIRHYVQKTETVDHPRVLEAPDDAHYDAVDEMEDLSEGFRAIRAQKPGFPMPVLDALCAAMPPWKELRRRDAKN